MKRFIVLRNLKNPQSMSFRGGKRRVPKESLWENLVFLLKIKKASFLTSLGMTIDKSFFKCLVFIFILFSSLSYSQIKKVEQKSTDVFEELGTGNLTLRFFNAVNGKEINGATVTIMKIGEYISDEEGKIIFPPPEENGTLMVSFRSEGYVPTDFPIEIMAGTLFFNRISISPMLDIKFLRIVVDWDKQPYDLDAHFLKGSEYHISFRNMRVLTDGSAMLDRDAMNGYGPETITVKEISGRSVYEYYIHDYSNQSNTHSKGLSNSKATVKVYGESKLLKIFQVPRNKEGNIWKVFKVVNGQVSEVNQFTNN